MIEEVVFELRPIDGVGEVILVASGKGGVGKSTVTVNLACALHRLGLNVGVLDADLYGPSVARMLGTGDGLSSDDEGRAVPACGNGVHSVSVANVLPPESALAWKGPLAVQALTQLFREVAWPNLDILLVDLPPGTGDIPLTILEQMPVAGAVVVTTPQRLSTVDAERAIALFHEHDIPVFGVVENMSGYVCPCCGERQELFSGDGAMGVARRLHVAHLGNIPLDPAAQGDADSGRPIVLAHPDGPAAAALNHVASGVLDALGRELKARARARDAEVASDCRKYWEGLIDD